MDTLREDMRFCARKWLGIPTRGILCERRHHAGRQVPGFSAYANNIDPW
jgi:hypothetical protein